MAQIAVAAQTAQKSTLHQALDKLVGEGEVLAHDISIWAARMSDGEKLVWLSLFILLLFSLIVFRQPKRKKKRRSEEGQFVFAFATVVIVGFGAGWIFDGRFNLLGFL